MSYDAAPKSEAFASIDDLRRTKNLKDCLAPEKVQDTKETLAKRLSAMDTLSSVVNEWLQQHYKDINHADPPFELRAKILTFGSYRLGVNTAKGDIDVLICFPQCVQRDDFFTSFYDFLSLRGDVEELHAAEDAFVPAIKLDFAEVEMDLLMVRFPERETVPADLNISDDNILLDLDPRCARSLNGPRVTDKIMQLVNDSQRNDFRVCLKTIKLWAKRRGLVSNSLGLFGGVHMAMLVCKICQFYPHATASTLVEKFFHEYAEWDWETPIRLCHVQDLHFDQLYQWDEEHVPRDRGQLMKILTPMYPSQNASFNVSSSTLFHIKRELERGRTIVDEVIEKKKSKNGEEVTWAKLWKAPPFFSMYSHYLTVTAMAGSVDILVHYEGLIESTIRKLITDLELSKLVAFVVPYPKSFRRTPTKEGPSGTTAAPDYGADGADTAKPAKEAKGDGEKGDGETPSEGDKANIKHADMECYHQTHWFLGFIFGDSSRMRDGRPAPVSSTATLNIAQHTSTFADLVSKKEEKSSHYDDSMHWAVNHLSSEQLPEWLFSEEGQLRRNRKKMLKKKKQKRASGVDAENPTKKAAVLASPSRSSTSTATATTPTKSASSTAQNGASYLPGLSSPAPSNGHATLPGLSTPHKSPAVSSSATPQRLSATKLLPQIVRREGDIPEIDFPVKRTLSATSQNRSKPSSINGSSSTGRVQRPMKLSMTLASSSHTSNSSGSSRKRRHEASSQQQAGHTSSPRYSRK